ncbi:hypothetical protein VHEMI09125 [[Torrubiella] hemipterigena]|uniref:Choline monooxygenase, chloroplastic n=1 Tax=[Torrubiella] hemipterigena TaxID=1531966 RepID=A0A0A1TPR1_9HYPO|nr:hypothetical protein VHEMI09125 [[Torrubiella] hemipterigena]
MLSWLTSSTTASQAEPETVLALPANWYTSPAMLELERRAIFSKKWILITHKLRFPEVGSYVKITEAGYSFFLIKDRNGEIRGHHNVCRHRAYPLVENESGKKMTLACKYHGWSYGFDGKLAKAPKYQEIPSFNKEENGLYKVHVHIDKLGFVWVNLDAAETPSFSWEADFASVDEQPRFEIFNMDDYHYDHSWDMIGEYNWKVLADNYNECYHCPTGHPGLPAVTDLNKYWVETAGSHIQHFAVDHADRKGLGNFSTYMYPNTSITLSPIFFFIQRVIPISATQTSMEYEVYRHNDSTDEEFTHVSDFFKQVMKEDKDLCNATQHNLESGIFLSGELHPRVEKGPLFFQQMTHDLITSHHREEQDAGRQIWPAVPKHKIPDRMQADINLCASLDCTASRVDTGELAW